MKRYLLYALFSQLSFFAFAQTTKLVVNKPPIDSIAVENWLRLGNNVALSNDGSYFMYDISKQQRRSKAVVVQSLVDNWKKEIPSIDNGFFSQDSKQFYFQRKDTLFFYQLGIDSFTTIPAIKTFSHPKNIQRKYIGYRLKGDNSDLVVVNLLSGKQQRFDSVEDFSFSDNGNVLVLKKSRKQNDQVNTLLNWVDLESGKVSEIWRSDNSNLNIANYYIDQSEKQLAFIVQVQNKIDGLWYYKTGMEKAVEKVSNKTIEDGLIIAASAPEFSEDGNYIFFKLQHPQKPKPAKIDVSLDVWSYKDTLIQETQLFQRLPTYDAAINTQGNQIIQLTHDYERIKARPVNNDYVVVQYEASGDRFWLEEAPCNFLVSLKNGHRILLETHTFNDFWFSPDGTYLVYYDFNQKGDYFNYNLSTGEKRNISQLVTEPLNMVDEFFKGRTIGRAVGIAGWVEKDAILVYDNYDIWKLDLTGKYLPINVTKGFGRVHKVKFKVIKSIDKPFTKFVSNDTLLLSAFNVKDRYNGFFQKIIGDSGLPEQLVMGPYTFFNPSTPTNSHDFNTGIKPFKAANRNVWIISRQSFNEAPNYFITSDLKNFKRLTDFNAQKEYNWLNAKLQSWKQFDGTIGQGILYTPENFDPNKKYPVIINYYQQLTHRLYQFPTPSFPNNNINVSWFASQGYLVFTPDIYFQNGRLNGQSAYNSIVSGAKYLQSLPFVDGMRIGINGHSNAGSYTNYLITHTNMFAAAIEGAGSSDIVSNFLQLSGIQGKERGTRLGADQNIGATLWQRPDLYLENSPILKADRISTPLIIFHSQADEAVPWQQGVELYLALRRLNKPTWMLQYDGQGHGNAAGPYASDYTIRSTQFFDHYLKGAPAPRWMTKGIPAAMKGIETGFELDPAGNCGTKENPCKVCIKWNEQYKKNLSLH